MSNWDGIDLQGAMDIAGPILDENPELSVGVAVILLAMTAHFHKVPLFEVLGEARRLAEEIDMPNVKWEAPS